MSNQHTLQHTHTVTLKVTGQGQSENVYLSQNLTKCYLECFDLFTLLDIQCFVSLLETHSSATHSAGLCALIITNCRPSFQLNFIRILAKETN